MWGQTCRVARAAQPHEYQSPHVNTSRLSFIFKSMGLRLLGAPQGATGQPGAVSCHLRNCVSRVVPLHTFVFYEYHTCLEFTSV
jgi:hypothetical protein